MIERAYQKRFGNHTIPLPAAGNELIEQILGRSSTRNFIDRPLEPGLLELLIATAQSSSSTGGLQVWSVVALSTPAEKHELVHNVKYNNLRTIGGRDSQNPGMLEKCSTVLIWLADLSRINMIINQSDDPSLQNLMGLAENNLKAIIDATIAAQTFSIAAESMGLGICYCGAIRQLNIEFFNEYLNLPKFTFPIFGMAVGYPVAHLAGIVKPRLPTDMVLHHGQYAPMTDMDQIAQYNATGIAITGRSYSNRVLERTFSTPSKHRVGHALSQMGFDFE